MVELSEPAHLTDMAGEIVVQHGERGKGKNSFFVCVESKNCKKRGGAHGGLFTMMIEMGLCGAFFFLFSKKE